MGRAKNPKKKMDVERIFFSFTETQEFLGVSHQTVYKLMQEGLASHKIGKKRVFLKEDLINWVKDH
jgi:excisionase family DNA binding protein